MKRINIGLIGLGTVGTGVVRLLRENDDIIRDRLGAEIVLKRVAVSDLSKGRGVDLEHEIMTADARDVITDPEIAIVVELVGGIEPARSFILEAVGEGKSVVTANKALLSTHGMEIFDKVDGAGVDIGFEASVAGGVPVIKAIKEGLPANRITSIYGIINGTANYILSKMTHDGGSFDEILRDAQEKGYAEADPTYDVDGIDAAHKLAILVNLAFGTPVGLDRIYTEGITNITPMDINFATEFGYRIKLLAIAKDRGGRIEARVHPTMIRKDDMLATVEGVYNAIHIYGNGVGPVLFYGKGAGMMPTASAVVADIIDICRNINKGISGRVPPLSCLEGKVRSVDVWDINELEIPYYIRFSAIDRPGVLSKISGVLGDHNISILSVIQKDRKVGDAVPLVIVTHHARERELVAALTEIDEMDVIKDKTVYLRIEEQIGGDS